MARASLSSLIFVFAFVMSGCVSQTLLRDRDYDYSLNAFRQGDSDNALTLFPKKEQGGFITSVEKGWLKFWSGKPDVAPLLAQSKTFDDRKFVSLTREAQVFLIQESEEGYVPSEHEVVVLHLVAAMNEMELGRWEEAEVEARLAGFYLQNQFNENQPHFDDPALRLWLASVWAGLGHWESAQVDLRRAAALSNDAKLREFAEGRAPKNLTITFHGVGPDLVWSKASPVPSFKPVEISSSAGRFAFTTTPWFEHHKERNTVLRDTLMKSNYMAQYVGVESLDVATRGVGATGAFAVGTIGVAAGLGIIAGGIYLAQYAGGSELPVGVMMAGVGVTAKSVLGAKDIYRDISHSADAEERRQLEDMRTYRFVRFLPNWISIDTDGSENSDGIRREFKAPRAKTSTCFQYVW